MAYANDLDYGFDPTVDTNPNGSSASYGSGNRTVSNTLTSNPWNHNTGFTSVNARAGTGAWYWEVYVDQKPSLQSLVAKIVTTTNSVYPTTYSAGLSVGGYGFELNLDVGYFRVIKLPTVYNSNPSVVYTTSVTATASWEFRLLVPEHTIVTARVHPSELAEPIPYGFTAMDGTASTAPAPSTNTIGFDYQSTDSGFIEFTNDNRTVKAIAPKGSGNPVAEFNTVLDAADGGRWYWEVVVDNRGTGAFSSYPIITVISSTDDTAVVQAPLAAQNDTTTYGYFLDLISNTFRVAEVDRGNQPDLIIVDTIVDPNKTWHFSAYLNVDDQVTAHVPILYLDDMVPYGSKTLVGEDQDSEHNLTPTSEVQSCQVMGVIDLYEINFRGTILRVTPLTGSCDGIPWRSASDLFLPFPMTVSDISSGTDTVQPTPTMKISNINKIFAGLIFSQGDLSGAVVTRWRILDNYRYGQPGFNPAAAEVQARSKHVFIVTQTESMSATEITLNMTTHFDRPTKRVPSEVATADQFPGMTKLTAF